MISFKSFKDMNTSECLKKLNQEGHYCFENLLNDTELNTLTKLVESKLKENNNKYFFLADNKLDETFINNKEFLSYAIMKGLLFYQSIFKKKFF